jgi:hypothetical protein
MLHKKAGKPWNAGVLSRDDVKAKRREKSYS